MNELILKYYKIYKEAPEPKVMTDGSACFDLSAFLPDNSYVTYYNCQNTKRSYQALRGVRIGLGERFLIPTGLILDIPKGYSVRIHPRSSMSLKRGMILANSEGVIDSDYVELIVYNGFQYHFHNVEY